MMRPKPRRINGSLVVAAWRGRIVHLGGAFSFAMVPFHVGRHFFRVTGGGVTMPDKVLTEVPEARPVKSCETHGLATTGDDQPIAVRVDVEPFEPPLAQPLAIQGAGAGGGLVVGNREPLSIISLACGLTGIIPIVTQVIGLGTGIAGLVRIRRARRRGIVLRGTGFAITGIVSSSAVLLGWVAAAVALSLVGDSLSGSTANLLDVARQMP